MYEEWPDTHYYTHKELRSIAKERNIKLGTNVTRKYMCEKLNLPEGDRGGLCFKCALERVRVMLIDVVSDEFLIFPSLSRAVNVLGVGSMHTVKSRIRTGKVFRVKGDITFRSGKTFIYVPDGAYRLEYWDD